MIILKFTNKVKTMETMNNYIDELKQFYINRKNKGYPR